MTDLRRLTIPPSEVPMAREDGSAALEAELSSGRWLPPHPTPLTVVLAGSSAAALWAAVALRPARDVASGLALVWPWWLVGVPAAVGAVLVLLSSSAARSRRPLLTAAFLAACAVPFAVAGLHVQAGAVSADAVLASWAAAWAAVLLWPRRAFATERAWLVGRPAYRRAALRLTIVAIAVPVAAAAGSSLLAERLAARYQSLAAAMRQPDSCLGELERTAPAEGPLDTLALASFGAGSGLGPRLAACVVPMLQLDRPLAGRLHFAADEICRAPEQGGANATEVAVWRERRARVARLHRLAQALPEADGRAYLAHLEGLAEGVCDDPYLLAESLLLREAAPSGPVAGCGTGFDAERLAAADWIRRGLAHLRELGAPAVFEAPGLPSRPKVFRARAQEAPGPGGRFRSVQVGTAVLIRPREGDGAMDVGLHVRWVPPAEVRDPMYPGLAQSGAEVYLVTCGAPQDEDALLRALREEWGFSGLEPMGTSRCPPPASERRRRVLWFPGGEAWLVAERESRASYHQVRLAFTREDPCRR